MARNKYWTYTDDTEVRGFLAMAWNLTEGVWKHLEEYADPETKGKELAHYNAHSRGIQQAAFRLHNVWQEGPGEICADSLMDAVNPFYLAALQVAEFLDSESNGGVGGEGLREYAKMLLWSAQTWHDAERHKINPEPEVGA